MEIRHVDKKELSQKTKAFFQSQSWKNILVFLIFVLLAFCFWMMQYFQQKMEREITLPVTYINVPTEIVLSDSSTNQITLRIADKGTVFLRYYYNRKNMVVKIDLTEIPLDKNTFTVDRSKLNFEIQDLLFNTTQLQSFKPENIQVRYYPLEKKELPVVINGKINPAPGYIFTDSLIIEPSHIWVYGNKETLDTLITINTVSIKQENIHKDLNIYVKLEIPQATHLSFDQVNISSQIEEYTEKKFTLPIICYNIPDDINIRFFPSSVEVACQIALSKYHLLTENDLEVSIDYNELTTIPDTNVILELTQKPEWLINYRIIPETIEFLIEQN